LYHIFTIIQQISKAVAESCEVVIHYSKDNPYCPVLLYTLITHCYHISDTFKRQCVAYIIYRILTIIQQISEGSCRIMLRIEVIQLVLKQTIQHYLFMSNLQQFMKPEFYTLGMPLHMIHLGQVVTPFCCNYVQRPPESILPV
jgi:hypothetical protein